MNPDVAQSGCFASGEPHLMAEPVGGDVPVGVPGARRARAVPASSPAAGAVVGIGFAPVLASAFRRVVGGKGAVSVPAAFLVRLGHSRRGSGAAVGATCLGLGRSLVAEDQVMGAEVLGRDVGLDLRGDLPAELEPAVFLVFRVVLDQEPFAFGVVFLG